MVYLIIFAVTVILWSVFKLIDMALERLIP